MTTQDILTQLTTPNEELPLAALEAAMNNPQPLIPELLSLLQTATVNSDYLIENEFYRGHIYALYLLASFREPRAYPLMIDFFSIPGDRFMEVAEDIVNEAGPFLASVCQGDDHLIKGLLENEQANEYARSEAAQALVILVACGSQSRDELVTYFQSLFRGKLQRQPNVLWNNLVELAIDLYPEELYSDLRRAYAEDLVQPPVVPLKHLDTRLTLDKQRVLKRLPRKYRRIDNPVAKLTERFGFTSEEKQKYVSDVVLNLTSNLGYFPRDSVQQAIAQRDLTKQMLMIFLQHTVERTFAVEEGDFTGHLYALYLLAQFREKEAYPWIVDLFSIPGEVSLNITGDVVTEDLHRILASVYDGDDSLLKGLVEDPKVNEYVRSAALQTFLVLVTTGQQSRETVMAYYQSLFHGKLERDQPFLWGSLIDCCTNLYPQEVYTDIQTAFAENLVEEFFIDMDFVQKTYAQGQEAVLKQLHQNPYYTLIEDTIEDMEKWHWGTSSTKTESSPPPSSAKLKKPSEPRLSTVRTGPKIGRNDPCPCGSGKKYKKCCGK